MGADITLFVEHKNEKTGEWKCVNLYSKNYETGEVEMVQPWNGRNYILFDKLNLDNNWGKRLVEGERDLPKDLSPEVQEKYQSMKDWCYGASCFDLYELMLINETDRVKVVYEDEWEPNEEEGETWEDCPKANIFEKTGFLREIIHCLEMQGIYPTEKFGENRVIFWFDG